MRQGETCWFNWAMSRSHRLPSTLASGPETAQVIIQCKWERSVISINEKDN